VFPRVLYCASSYNAHAGFRLRIPETLFIFPVRPVAHDAFFRSGSVAGFSYLAPEMGPLLERARTRCLLP